MAAYSKETTIKRSPEDVFAYVSDMTKHGEWGANKLAVQKTSDGATGIGSTFASTAELFGTQKETQTVTEYAPGRRFAFEAKGSLGVARHVFEMAASGDGTRLTKSMELIKPSFLARLMTFKIGMDQPKALAQDVERIRAKLEE
jgi:hypothetical protein